MFSSCALLAILVVFEASSQADTLELGETKNVVLTETHEFGEDVTLDCNFSHNASVPVWRRVTLEGSQLLYAGQDPIRDVRNIHLSSVNYSLFVNSVAIDDEGLYVCSQSGRTLTSYRLKVTVTSEIVIQHEDKNLSGIYFANKGEELRLDCIVFRARKSPGIEWKVSNTTLVEGRNETTSSSNKFVEGTFDYRKGLTFVVQRETNLVCSTSSDCSTSVLVKLSTVTFHTPDPGNYTADSTNDTEDSTNYTAKATTNNINNTALIAIVPISFVITVIAGTWVCMKRYKGKESQSNNPRGLAEIPKPKPSYARNIVQIDYYFPGSYGLPTSKLFLRKSIRLMKRFSDGVICERWVGKVTTAKRENSALISCYKGIHFDHFSWDTLVKRLLELPDNQHIFKVKGMCFDKPHLFLLQDYTKCEALPEHLSVTFGTEATQNEFDMFVSKLTNISLQVCYGMEFAMKYGLSHPVLSTRKILINEDGICKLYDFCLTKDASKCVECLKFEPEFLAMKHPPECVVRNEYTCASDVWYTAFCVREIYSYGCKQFPRDRNFINEESETYSLPLQSCPTSVCEQLRKCMTPNDNVRPKTVQELLTILKELDPTPVSNSPSHVVEKIRKYSYVPMIDGTGEVLYSLPVKNKEVMT
ncbi:Tyrosine-protein kinase CSK [Holothuria leucospilota]|uniref:Tyrosine-protein kinase CSK n=1 Tax=Holothuria leucospilota TaxID=206669 RepID=A0A9Q1CD93_HOLLE|nr:Tyrosine-protein kinase CSK [Holothuria leucospilota]